MKHLDNTGYTQPECRVMTVQIRKVLCVSGPNSAPKVIYDDSETEYTLG